MKKIIPKRFMKWLVGIFVILAISGCGVDTELPVLNPKNQIVEYGTKLNYSDFVEVSDNSAEEVQVEVTSKNATGISIDSEEQTVTFENTGRYELEISASDVSGNTASDVVEIEVVDTQSPEILSYNDTISVEYNKMGKISSKDTFLELHIEDKSEYTVFISGVENTEEEDLTKAYELNDAKDSISFLKLGTYYLEFSVEDSFGNVTTERATVEVVDKAAPVISCKQESFLLTDSDKDCDYLKQFRASDEIDGDLTDEIQIDDFGVSYGEVGEYQILVSVKDKSDNLCEMKYDVIIEDKTAPELSLSKTSFSLTVNSKAPDYSSIAKAVDKVDGNISELIEIDDSDVDYSKAGTYTVKYTVSDANGNVVTKKVTVTVKKESNNSSGGSSGNNSGGSSSGGSSVSSDSEVMITKTGSCYHTHKCGNGNYFWVSLSEALSRGLRACKKCY